MLTKENFYCFLCIEKSLFSTKFSSDRHLDNRHFNKKVRKPYKPREKMSTLSKAKKIDEDLDSAITILKNAKSSNPTPEKIQ